MSDESLKKEIEKELTDIYNDLDSLGYEATHQIVSYLVSGDPGYISSHNDSRNRIVKYKREDILEIMLEKFIKQ